MEYLSDDENEEKEELTFEEEYPDEELDDETRALCFIVKDNDDDDDYLLTKSDNKVKNKSKEPKKNEDIMSLKTFIENIEEKEKNNKWQSKRVENKKLTGEKKEKIIQRQFNPRLPPYKLVKREKIVTDVDIANKKDFPKL